MDDMKRDAAAIVAQNLTKTYKLYGNVTDQAIDILGLNWLFFWRTIEPQHFGALNDFNVEIFHGERVGIIGQNGAGKTTFLKLITGAISATEGDLKVNGDIQALMQVGLGFHPEFTGLENISASLLYSGLSEEDKQTATEDIIEFCELEQFLEQPLKTYSLGMQARLQFACATAIKPDILVVDEILGAGDAYFSMKSSARMESLTKSGCTLLLVSHSMGQVLQFCERVIWINEGRVVRDGPALKVVKAYEQWMHEKSFSKGLVSSKVREKIESSSNNRRSDQVVNLDELVTEVVGGIDGKIVEVNETKLPEVFSSRDKNARWETKNTALQIHDICLRDASRAQCSIFPPDSEMTIEIHIEAQEAGQFPCAVVVHIMSEDGRSVIWSGSDSRTLEMEEGDVLSIDLLLAPLMLNCGRYTVSAAIFDQIVPLNKASAYRYDLVSRTRSFAVMDAYDGNDSLFRHPSTWGKFEKIKIGEEHSNVAENEHGS